MDSERSTAPARSASVARRRPVLQRRQSSTLEATQRKTSTTQPVSITQPESWTVRAKECTRICASNTCTDMSKPQGHQHSHTTSGRTPKHHALVRALQTIVPNTHAKHAGPGQSGLQMHWFRVHLPAGDGVGYSSEADTPRTAPLYNDGIAGQSLPEKRQNCGEHEQKQTTQDCAVMSIINNQRRGDGAVLQRLRAEYPSTATHCYKPSRHGRGRVASTCAHEHTMEHTSVHETVPVGSVSQVRFTAGIVVRRNVGPP